MIRILNAVLRRYGRIADQKIAASRPGCGQLQYCADPTCGAVRETAATAQETDAARCTCGAPWVPADTPDQPHLF